MAINLAEFKKYPDWIKLWSGKFSLLTDSHFGYHWTVQDLFLGRPCYPRVIYFFKNGITDCWVPKADKDDFGGRLVGEARKSKDFVKKLADSLREGTDGMFKKLKESKLDMSLEEYDAFWNYTGDYYLKYVSIKYIVDFFTEDEFKEYFPMVEDARKYSELVYRTVEEFVEKQSDNLAKRTNLSFNQILALLKTEMQGYLEGKSLPEAALLDERYRESGVVFDRGESQLFIGSETSSLKEIVEPKSSANELKGDVAQKGKVRGIVRIVLNPYEAMNIFKKDEILVTGMTRPEFLPLMEKAAAFVTDAGGILSHAAIVAREMKKPCIIGTKIATKVLKDGDVVEVDANLGTVKILK